MVTASFAQDGEHGMISLTDAERALVAQNSDFAFNLFRKTRDTENHVISPLRARYPGHCRLQGRYVLLN